MSHPLSLLRETLLAWGRALGTSIIEKLIGSWNPYVWQCRIYLLLGDFPYALVQPRLQESKNRWEGRISHLWISKFPSWTQTGLARLFKPYSAAHTKRASTLGGPRQQNQNDRHLPYKKMQLGGIGWFPKRPRGCHCRYQVFHFHLVFIFLLDAHGSCLA